MQILRREWVVSTFLTICLSSWGCSKAPTQAPVKSVTSTVPAAAPAQGASAPSAPGEKSKSKPTSNERKSSLAANVDPKSVFVVRGPGQIMEIEATRAALPTDRYLVASADPLNDSSRFVVSEVTRTSQSTTPPVQRKAGFTLPKGFEDVKEYGFTPEGFPQRILCNKTGFQLACVPAGPSILGSDTGPDVSKPSITVELDTFYMQVLEVTIQDFEKFRVDMREKKKPVPPAPSNASDSPETPALGLPWGVAVGYARWAGMELPTEAEFEKSARGSHGMRTPWGEGKPLWGSRTISATGLFAADRSPYGIYDLAGNASEWCSDLFSPTAHEEAVNSIAREGLKNWSGPKKVRDMNLRVIKGNGENWSIWDRIGKDMGKGHSNVGFRCVLRISLNSKASDATKAFP